MRERSSGGRVSRGGGVVGGEGRVVRSVMPVESVLVGKSFGMDGWMDG